jgi:hypothetical protein
MCCKGGGGGCKGNLHQGFSLWNLFQRCVRSCGPVQRGLRAREGFSLWNIVSVLYEVFRPGSTKYSIYRSIIVQVLD